MVNRRGLGFEAGQIRPRHVEALLLHLARIAVERGSGRMEWTVLDWNEPAIRFDEAGR